MFICIYVCLVIYRDIQLYVYIYIYICFQTRVAPRLYVVARPTRRTAQGLIIMAPRSASSSRTVGTRAGWKGATSTFAEAQRRRAPVQARHRRAKESRGPVGSALPIDYARPELHGVDTPHETGRHQKGVRVKERLE